VSWEGPGFVDHHAHLLRVAAGRLRPWCEEGAAHPDLTATWHREVARRDSTPMDEPVRPLEVHDGLRGALERALVGARDLGLVQVTEAGMDDWAYLEALLGLRARGPLPVRVRLLVASGIADVARMTRTGDPWLEIEGVKFYADGWLGPHTCALCSPYADRPDEPGVLFLDAEELARRCDPFAQAGLTIATHAIGDRAIASVLDAYEMVFGADCRAAAPRIEHAQVLDEDLIRRMADLGVVACVQPGFAVSDAAAARRALGPDRYDLAYRWDLLLDAGVRLLAGSDHPVESLSPLVGLQRLTTGDFEDGRRAGAATLDVGRAYDLLTDAACGTVVLADDPHGVAEDELARLAVEEARPAG
jgi:predicted amidohydrolase YtcJ